MVPDPNGGWFGNEFSLLSNLHARASGITYCDSSNDGGTWTCRLPLIPFSMALRSFPMNVRMGGRRGDFPERRGMGASHCRRRENLERADAERSLADPRDSFVTPKIGWATGGNYSSNVGGMHYSSNGGKAWALDVTTGAEMDACDSKPVGTKFQAWRARIQQLI